MFQLFNLYHWIYIVIATILFILLDRVLIKIEKDKQYRFLFILSIANFCIHFLKVLLEPEASQTSKIYRTALTNLCAVNTFFYPFVLKSKNKSLLNYFEFMGFFSGLIALVVCPDLNDTVPFKIENIRYWITHFILMFISFELMRTKMVKFSYRLLPFCYLCFFIEQGIIYLNDYVLFVSGVTDCIDYSNASFTYGIKDSFQPYLGFANYLIPSIFYKDGIYTPLLWMIFPMLVVLLLAFIFTIIFIDREQFIADFKKIKEYIKDKISKKKT